MNSSNNIINNPIDPLHNISQNLSFIHTQSKENASGDNDVVGFKETFIIKPNNIKLYILIVLTALLLLIIIILYRRKCMKFITL